MSDGEFEAVKMICDWAARRNLLHKVEVLGFVDGHTSVNTYYKTGMSAILIEGDAEGWYESGPVNDVLILEVGL